MSERKKARRGRGEGSVTKRPDGSWQGQLSAGTNPDGSRRRVFVNAPTKHECLAELSQARSKLAQGTFVSPESVTVEGYLVRWLAAIKGSVKASTYESYERYVHTHIVPAIGTVKLQKLDMLHVEIMLTEMKRKTREMPSEKLKQKRWGARSKLQPVQPSAHRTKKYARYILVKALDHAIKGNLIPRNVADLSSIPSSQATKEMTILDETGVKKLLSLMHVENPERYARLYCLSVLTGMRQGEYLALQWPDIDFKADPPIIRVRRTQTYSGGTVSLAVPKTKAGKRSIPLTQQAVDILLEQRKQMLKEGHLGKQFVFVDEAGEMLIRSGPVRSCLLRLIAQAGLPRMTPHDMRHTHATLLLRAGVNPKVAAERLGHSNVRILLETYSHVLPDTQADVITKLDRLLG